MQEAHVGIVTYLAGQPYTTVDRYLATVTADTDAAAEEEFRLLGDAKPSRCPHTL